MDVGQQHQMVVIHPGIYSTDYITMPFDVSVRVPKILEKTFFIFEVGFNSLMRSGQKICESIFEKEN